MSSGMKCENCGKGVTYGHNMSHAKNRTNRTFAPNLHTTRVTIDGISKRTKLCTKCLRKIKRENKPKVASPAISVVTSA